MTKTTEHRAFFGDGEKLFAFPTRELIEELERKTGQPIGTLFRRFRDSDYSFSDILETIRLGLIGGGTSPQDADRLVTVYGIGRPLAEVFDIADGVIAALFFGVEPDEPEDDFDFPQDAPQDDHAAAIHDALAQVAA